MIQLNISGPQGVQGISGSNLLGNSKWRMSAAINNSDVYPVDGYFKFFQDGPSLQFAINEINSSSSSVLEFLTSSKTLLQSEGLIVTVIQNDDPSIYKSGLISAISSVYPYPVGSGNAAIIASLILNASGEFTEGKEYSILINVRGDTGAQGVQGSQGVQGVDGYQGPQGLQGHQGASGGPQGVQGVQGAQGPQGYQGVVGGQGVQGSQGAQGPQGLFGGPQGFQGVQGPQGHQGNPQGPQGFPGPVGAMGPQAPQGPQGYAGPQGPQGVQGAAGGPQGYQGVQGAQGPQGHQGMYGGPQGATGPTGSTGVRGYPGPQGVQGSQGVQGNQGFQGEPGFVGAQGTQGVQGTQGFQGTQGTQGVQGAQGFQGTQGAQGVQGSSVQGAQGTQGTQGTQGVQGFQGTQGTQGVQGDTTGPQGPQGVQGAAGPGNGVNASYTDLGDSTVSLLLHMDGANESTTFTDNSYTTKIPAANGTAKISTATSKFGSASGSFNGSGYLNIPYSSDFDLSSGDFTIEGWVNLSSVGAAGGAGWSDATTMTVVTKHNSGIAADWLFSIDRANYVHFYTNGAFYYREIPAITTGAWYHFAVVKNSGTYAIYWNGTQAGDSFVTATTNSVSTLGVGADRPNSPRWYVNGYIDEIRISKGIARYTGNFTPSTSAFANADAASYLPANPTLGQIVYSGDGFYVCSATSPATWKKYSSTPVTIYP